MAVTHAVISCRESYLFLKQCPVGSLNLRLIFYTVDCAVFKVFAIYVEEYFGKLFHNLMTQYVSDW